MPGSWLVLSMDFSTIPTDDPDTFHLRLHEYLNWSVKKFRALYRDRLTKPMAVHPENAIVSLQSPFAAVQASEYKRRLLVLVDTGVNAALRDSRLLHYSATDANVRAGQHTLQRVMSPIRTVFAALKRGLALGGVGRVYITGVAPVALTDFRGGGFNVASDLSELSMFQGLFGFSEAEVRHALERVCPAHAALSVDHALAEIRREFNGYRFAARASSSVYNSTQVMHYLRHYASTGAAPPSGYLVDNNVCPANNAVLPSTASATCAVAGSDQRFVDRKHTGAAVPGELYPSVGVADILTPGKLAEMSSQKAHECMLSYLYYMGAVTYAPVTPTSGAGGASPGFVIANAAIRRDFDLELHMRLQDDA